MSRDQLLAYTDAEEIGGAEECLATVLSGVSDGFRITVVGVSSTVTDWVAMRVSGAGHLVLPKAPSKASVGPGLAHIRAFRKLKPDLVHLNLRHPYACQWGTVAALTSPRARVLAVEHLPMAPANGRQAAIKRLLTKRLDAHVAVGREAARSLERWVGLPADSVKTIYNGRPSDRVERMADRPAGFACVSVGRLHEQKGFDVLLDALADVAGASVRIVGDGPERAALEQRASERGVADRVSFVGWSDDPRAELGRADLFVLPSRYEGLPLSIIEAMFAELPIVACDVGSVSELLLHEECGLLVPRDDVGALAAAITRLRDDDELCRRLGSAARARAIAHFSLAGMVDKYQALYEGLLR